MGEELNQRAGAEGLIDPAASSRQPQIVFQYIKSNFFRVMFADGFIAGPSVAGGIHLEAFNTRSAIPQMVTHSVGPDGMMGPEVESERVAKKDLVREVECEIVIPLETAKELVKLLQNTIAKIEEIRKTAEVRIATEQANV